MTPAPKSVRGKLVAAFAGLAAITLLVVAVAFYTGTRWASLSAETDLQYRRSLLIQRVRADAFQALQEVGEVDDVNNVDIADARGDFERALAPAERDFREWAALAATPTQRAEVARVRVVFDQLVTSARRVFAAAESDRPGAIQLADDEVDTKDFARFAAVTDRVALADRERRQVLARRTDDLRRTAQAMLAAAIGAVSLVLLIAAFLGSDLFRPLRELQRVIGRMADGDADARADADRGDEFGAIAAGVNRVGERLATLSESTAGRDDVTDGSTSPEVRGALLDLAHERPEHAGGIGRLLALARLRDPVPMATEPVEPVALVQQALARFGAGAGYGVAVELSYALPTVPIHGDPARLAAALDIVLDRLADWLPAKDRRIGVRCGEREGAYRIEMAAPGPIKAEEVDMLAALEPAALVARGHGGELRTTFDPQEGVVVQLVLPHAAAVTAPGREEAP